MTHPNVDNSRFHNALYLWAGTKFGPRDLIQVPERERLSTWKNVVCPYKKQISMTQNGKRRPKNPWWQIIQFCILVPFHLVRLNQPDQMDLVNKVPQECDWYQTQEQF